ncbi:HD domain-containing protein [Sutterella sp.]|uniref:HD domain-containing protein n=1 Tax=Sutterella sp. TaxID=1981025 RepID=UPI0026E048F4|nr:HD domain-containing protein [Sutterella sp.]MDO5531930.1 HD domain-containing protein [Sutterella sp.]
MLNTDRISAAFALAARVHAAQKRTGTEIPYISHPIAVASQVLVWGGSEDQFIAALLHDVLEDGGAEYRAVIGDGFGPAVLAMVEACSDAAPKPGEKKAPWLERKTAYLKHLETAGADALLVSAADKWHNLNAIRADQREIGNDIFLRFVKNETDPAKKRSLTLWYYEELIAIYRRRGVAAADELEAILKEIAAA